MRFPKKITELFPHFRLGGENMEYYVLLIDDNKSMAEIARAEWSKYNIGITEVTDVGEAVAELPNKAYVLIIIAADHVRGELDFVLKTLRVLTSAPILILSTEYNPHTKIAALKLGADEYLTESDTIEEDVVTGYALIRRYLYYNKQTSCVGGDVSGNDITVCGEFRIVFVKGVEIKLTSTEFEILALLMKSRKRILSYEAIFRAVWGAGYENSERDVLHNHIKRLRKKIRTISPNPEYIRSEPGVGYAFND
jgi:DNA-binding response OmpR family regulator